MRAINDAHDFEDVRAHEGTDVALDRIASQTSANRRRRLSWITHPDERVQLAVLCHLASEDKPWARGEDRSWAITTLWGVVTRRARSEGVVWIPVADQLAQLDETPWNERRLRYRPHGRPGRPEPGTLLHDLHELLATSSDPALLVATLDFDAPIVREFVARHPALEAEAVDRLVETPDSAIALAWNDQIESGLILRAFCGLVDALGALNRRRVGQWSEGPYAEAAADSERAATLYKAAAALLQDREPTFDGEAAQAVVDVVPTEDAELLEEAAQFGPDADRLSTLLADDRLLDQLSPSHLDELHRRLPDGRLRDRVLGQPHSPPSTWWRTIRSVEACRTGDGGALPVGRAFHTLAHHEVAPDNEVVWNWLLTTHWHSHLSYLAERYGGERARQCQVAIRQLLASAGEGLSYRHTPSRRLVDAFLEREHTDTSDLRWFYYRFRSNHEIVRQVLVHPEATLDLVEEILDDTDSRLVREEVLKVDRWREEAYVQQRLIDSVDPKLLPWLCRTQRGKKLRELFGRLASKAPMRALRLVESMEKERRADLEAAQLVPLLSAEKEEVREQAFRLLAEIGHPSSGP